MRCEPISRPGTAMRTGGGLCEHAWRVADWDAVLGGIGDHHVVEAWGAQGCCGG